MSMAVEHPDAGSWPQIRVQGRGFARAYLEAQSHNPAAVAVLRDARLHGHHPECLCRGEASPILLYVANWGDRFLLKRMPGTGPDHHPRCPSYGGVSPTARSLYDDAALREIDGRVRIALDAPLETVEHARPDHPPTDASDAGSAGRARSTITLLGLLHHLWENASLNFAHPQHRMSLSAAYERLQAACAECELGPRRPLPEQLFIPPATVFRRDAPPPAVIPAICEQWDRLARRAGPNRAPILLVLGELLSIEQRGSFGNLMLKFKGLLDLPVWARPNDLQQLRSRFPAPLERLAARGSRTPREDAPTTRLFLLAGTRLRQRQSKGQHAGVSLLYLYGSLLETTLTGIPVESAYEARMADYLQESGRSFRKPLRYDAAQHVFPDFEILDTDPPTAVEVWGMQTDLYLARKAEKVEVYRQQRHPLLSWNAAAGEDLPPLPEAVQRAAANT
jgi:hypothetical protein